MLDFLFFWIHPLGFSKSKSLFAPTPTPPRRWIQFDPLSNEVGRDDNLA